MSSIKIVGIPPGQAPEWVRKEWVGVVIPLLSQQSGGIQVGIRGGRPENQGGHQVSTAEAISVLEGKSPLAAKWWRENIDVATMPRFVFSRSVCEVV